MNIYSIFIIIIIFFLIVKFNKKNKEKEIIIRPKEIIPEEIVSEEIIPENANSYYPYSKKFLLTRTEYYFYRILKEKCDRNSLLICPKVRMEDFINVDAKQNINKYRGYIKSRHIDFIICDKDLYILAGLELDDPSHNSYYAQRVDNFKNDVFLKIGIPLYRIPVESKMYEQRINDMINHIIQNNIRVVDSRQN